MAQKKIKPQFQELTLSLIDRPDKTVRMEISEVEISELADSIRELGLLQPILVHPRGDRFEVIAGDRRFLAHKKLGLEKIMCCVKEIPADEIIWLRATENIQRQDLTSYEEGHIYVTLNVDQGFSVAAIGKKMGKSPGVVQRRMDILKMPDSFQRALHQKLISVGVAEELWRCPDPAKREYFLELAVEHGITVLVARLWVDDFKKSLQTNVLDVDRGGGDAPPFEDSPVYRACDLCKSPVDYTKLLDLRICQECGIGIRQGMNKQG